MSIAQKTSTQRVGNIVAGIIMIFFIIVSMIAVVEVSTRISARSFLNNKIDEVNAKLGALASESSAEISQRSSFFNDGPQAYSDNVINNPVREYRAFLRDYERLLDQVATLNFSGASTLQGTSYGIGNRLLVLEDRRREEQERDALFREEQRLINLESALENGLARLKSLESKIDDATRYIESLDIKSSIQIINLPHIDSFVDFFESQNPFEPIPNMRPPRFIERLLSDNSLPSSTSVPTLQRDQWRSFKSNYDATISNFKNEISSIDRNLVRVEERTRELSTKDTPETFWLSNIPILHHMILWPSDILLAIAVVACGGIGAVVSGLRDSKNFQTGNGRDILLGRWGALRDVTQGMAAGFIAFLIIKGGKFLFVVQAANAPIPVNPYAIAFAGILAGLFTERAYEVLTTLITQASDRIKSKDEPSEQKVTGLESGEKAGKDIDQNTVEEKTPKPDNLPESNNIQPKGDRAKKKNSETNPP